MYQEYLYGVDNMESFKHNIGILFSLYKIEYGFEISENKYWILHFSAVLYLKLNHCCIMLMSYSLINVLTKEIHFFLLI